MGQVRQNFPFSPPITYGFANSSASSQPPLRILQLYHLVPQSARLFLYRLLLPIGTYFYGTGTYGVLNVQRLPFNLYLKRAPSQRLVNEARALELVAKHTTLNAPRVLDFIELPAAEECWMLTTRIEGIMWSKFDLSQIPIPILSAAHFGGECRDCRIDHDNGGNGPYNKIEDLNKRLMSISSLIPEDADRALVAEVHSRPYRVFFTHADLKPGNVLVHSGRLSGIAYIKRLNSALVPGCLQIQTNRTRIDSPILYSTVAPSIQNPISTPPFRGILRCQFFKVQPFPVFVVSVHTPRSDNSGGLYVLSSSHFQSTVSSVFDLSRLTPYHRSHTTMEANGIYLILSVAAVEYHWGIYVAENATKGVIHHANNTQGGWSYERKLTQTLVLSKMLALALKIGTIPLPQEFLYYRYRE
ncbi:hypothetical protein BDBG_08121 [Blastomyces gilchristii SLH14081]|uniref:Aminoglycoside phosphotransferase domain-containing protein n=1 Tax=Blastomyces gilchristii (strain SLH14081) TaxID=559298 RepID=A0A179UXK4_BLAGS|nr:uncharacterized protein BDBG_08121 [Blastomyces gilchristii SLH14081]OAT12825.1 hypothetical protein BDBG_08121 [Blastomyces gilchristii SLH14081]